MSQSKAPPEQATPSRLALAIDEASSCPVLLGYIQVRREGEVPDSIEFRAKPEIALEMVARALRPSCRSDGQHLRLRLGLNDLSIGYVVAVPVKQCISAVVEGSPRNLRVDKVASDLPETAWERLSAGGWREGPTNL